ncbi:MAG: hypothetical protein FWE94_03085 [Coriobacteriia bacterium]|nr:hypothetical protein [Coriobacteriia bacterium]
MRRTCLANNAIALTAYSLSAVIWCFLAVISTELDVFGLPWIIQGSISVLSCVAIGFFLRPLEKSSFLSVVSVPAALVLAFIFLLAQGGESGFYYFNLNPLAVLGYFLVLSNDSLVFLAPVMLLASPALPPLLMCAGMTLRKRFMNRRDNSKAAGQGA